MLSDDPGLNGLIIFALCSLLSVPFLMWIIGLQERIKQERILEHKRELNRKRIVEVEKRAEIHKSLYPSREEVERKRQEELIEENRKRLASKQPEDDSELAKLQRLKEDWLEDKIK